MHTDNVGSPALLTRPPGSRRLMQRGFTLIEMVIVLMVIAIMTAAAAPRLHRALSYHRTESAARRIKVDLEQARQRAKTISASLTVEFDLTTQAYTIAGLKDLDRRPAAYAVSLAEHPYDVELVAANFGGLPSVTFSGFGIPSQSGSIVVRAGEYQRTVTLDASGLADIQ